MFFISRAVKPVLPGLLVCSVLLTACGFAQGQSSVPYRLNPDTPVSKFVHSSWQNEDGLPQNTVRDIVQDARGYIWLATQAGLVRFDGVEFRVFTKSNVGPLESNQIEVLYKTRTDTIWIGTMGGGLTRLYNGRFMRAPTGRRFDNRTIRALHEDRRGNMWIGTPDSGLYRFDGRTLDQFTVDDGLSSNAVLSLDQDRRNYLWIGTDMGLDRYDHGTISRSDIDGLSGTAVPAVETTDHGAVWVGTSGDGLYRVTGGGVTRYGPEDGLPSDAVSALYADHNGALWIGLRAGGAARFYNDRFSSFTPQHGLTHSYVGAFYQDHEGTLWIGTDRGGLNQLRDSKFTTITPTEGLSHDVVFTVMEDREGTIWVGTDGGGLNRIDGGEITHITTEDGLTSSYIYSIAEGTDGSIWIGTWGGGLCRLNSGRFTCYTSDDGLTSNNIYAIEPDPRGFLWLGTEKGLMRFDRGRVTVYDASDGLAHNWVNAIHLDRRGVLWIGTFDGGVSRLKNDRFTTYAAAEGLESRNILTLHEDNDGTLWAGTQGGGLCRLHDGRFDCITGDEGLVTEDVLQIAEDDYDNLWLGGFNGIERVSIAQLNAIADGERRSAATDLFRTGDGLRSPETNGGVQPSSWKTADGRLLFATMKGLAAVDPANLVRNRVPPPVVLEHVTVEDRTISIDGRDTTLTLPPESKALEFHYTGLSFIASDQVGFEYKLEGYDDSWEKAGTRREAYYTNLPPGPYTFRVAARNNDGVESETAAVLSFYIEPHFYQTWWFYGLCAGAMMLLAVGGYTFRVRQLQAHQQALNKLVDEQTQALREREDELRRLNEQLEDEVQRQLDIILTERSRYERELIVAKQKAEESERLKSNILMNMSHEIRTPLATISGFSQELKERVPDEDEKFVEFIQRSSQRLLETLNSVLEMSQLEAGSMNLSPESVPLVDELRETVQFFQPQASSKNLSLHLDVPPRPVKAKIDRKSFHRIMNNLIGNAIKFTDQGGVSIGLKETSDDVEVTVTDTGTGIDPDFLPQIFEAFRQESSGPGREHAGTGLGLAITRHLVELMGGEIDVTSEVGEGTSFIVRLPKEEDG